MLKQSEILDEKYKGKELRTISDEIVFPVSDDIKAKVKDVIEYLRLSQDDAYAKKYKIRPGMGLSLVQLGINKRVFVISYKREDGSFEEYTVFNPSIISHSEELIYVEEGEGCLSVNKDVDGIIPRYARMTIKYYDENGVEQNVRVREEISVAFQHEIDHLNGILFIDKIDKKNPFKNKDNYRAI